MRRVALALAMLALGGAGLQAQDQHQGPVVYPASNPPAAGASNTAPSPASDGLAPDTNADLVPSAPPANANNSASTPDALAGPMTITPAIPQGGPGGAMNPAGNPLSVLSGATGAQGQQDDIYDIRPPFFYLKPLTWLWILLGVLVVIALGVVLWIWLKPLRALRAKTAYELALERLEKARGLLNENDPEPYAVFVSETVRSYLGQRFQAPSTRRTTEEFLRQMQADSSTPLAAHRDLLRGFLEACDLVKFAHYQPAREELEQVQQRAVSFITATRPPEGATA